MVGKETNEKIASYSTTYQALPLWTFHVLPVLSELPMAVSMT